MGVPTLAILLLLLLLLLRPPLHCYKPCPPVPSLTLLQAPACCLLPLAHPLPQALDTDYPDMYIKGKVSEDTLRRLTHEKLHEEIQGFEIPAPVQLSTKVFAASECGKRDEQEDTYVCVNNVSVLFNWAQANTARTNLTKNLSCCAVFDGHCGRAVSEYCRFLGSGKGEGFTQCVLCM